MQNQIFKLHLFVANDIEIYLCGLRVGFMESAFKLKHAS